MLILRVELPSTKVSLELLEAFPCESGYMEIYLVLSAVSHWPQDES
jgi:hypothetical protein